MWVLSKNICSAREVLTCFYAASTAFFSALIAFRVFQSKQECLKQASYVHGFPKKNQNQTKTKSKSLLQREEGREEGKFRLNPCCRLKSELSPERITTQLESPASPDKVIRRPATRHLSGQIL